MAEREAHLEVGIEPGNAVESAKRIEDSLKRLADSADKALLSLKALDSFRGRSANASTAPARSTATAATPAASSTRASSRADTQSAAAAQRLTSALTEAARSSQAFARAAARVSDAAASAAAALRTIRPPPTAASARPAPVPATTTPVNTAAPVVRPAVPAPAATIPASAAVPRSAPALPTAGENAGARQLDTALLSAARSADAFARANTQAADAVSRAAAALASVRAPQAPASASTAAVKTPAAPAPSVAPVVAPVSAPVATAPLPRPVPTATVTPTVRSAATSAPAPAPARALDAGLLRFAEEFRSALSSATRAVTNYARTVISAADAAARSAATFNVARPAAATRVAAPAPPPASAPVVTSAPRPASTPSGPASLAPAPARPTAATPPPARIADASIGREAEQLRSSLSSASRSVTNYSRAMTSAADAAARAAAAFSAARVPAPVTVPTAASLPLAAPPPAAPPRPLVPTVPATGGASPAPGPVAAAAPRQAGTPADTGVGREAEQFRTALSSATRSVTNYARAITTAADAAARAVSVFTAPRPGAAPAPTTATPAAAITPAVAPTGVARTPAPPVASASPVSRAPVPPSAPALGPARQAEAGLAREVEQLRAALSSATRSLSNYGRTVGSAADAAVRAAAVFSSVRIPQTAAAAPAPVATPAPAAAPARAPAPAPATAPTPSRSATPPTGGTRPADVPVPAGLSQFESGLVAASRSLNVYARAVTAAAESASRASTAFSAIRTTATSSPPPAAVSGAPATAASGPAQVPPAAPPTSAPSNADATRNSEILAQAMSMAARSVETFGRAVVQAGETIYRTAASLRSLRAPAGTAGGSPAGGMGGAGSATGTAAGAGPGTPAPDLQAFSAGLAQATTSVGAASQGFTAATQAAGAAASAFAQAAQRAAAGLGSARGGSAGTGGGGGGRGGGGIGGFGSIVPANQGGGGPTANAALSTARNLSGAISDTAKNARTAAQAMDKAFEKIHGSISNVTGRVMNLRTAFVALGAGVALRGLAETGMQFESLTKAMNIVTGDSGLAKQEMARLRDETDRLGLVTSTTADDYLKFLAAIKGSSVDAGAAKDAFFGVAQAMSLMGKGEESTSRALKAIEQIASKGQVYAEELKGQLGEALPGAMNIAATSMGMTVERMFEEMEKGTISAEKFFAVFNQGIQINFPVDRVDSARAEVARLTNAWQDFQKLAANSGFLDAWGDAAGRLAEKLNSIEGRVLAQELGEALGSAIKATADAMLWLADNADKVKVALLAVVGLQVVGFLTGVASAALQAAGAFKLLWAAAGMTGLGRLARGIGLIGSALGLGALAAEYFGEKTQDISSDMQGAENAINSYNEKIKSGKKITDDMAEAQRDLAIEMTNAAIAAEKSKLDKTNEQRKQLVDIAAPPDTSSEVKDQILKGEVKFDPNSTDEVVQELARIGKEAEASANKIADLQKKLGFLTDDRDIANRDKPKVATPDRSTLLQAQKTKGKKGGGGRSVESQFQEQKDELDAQIAAEQEITAAYGQGADAVEKQRRELEILRKVQKLKFEFNPKQVAELEQRIRALADATDQTAFKGSGAAIDEETQKIQRLTAARKESGDALSRQEAEEQARSEAASKGILHVAGAVETLTAKYMEQNTVRDEASNVEASGNFDKEVESINRIMEAMDLEGIARTRRIAELQEEARMIQENINLNTESARARIEAAGAAAVADMSMQGKGDLKNLERQIDLTKQHSEAMRLYGEERIRANAEDEKRNELLARGADMTDANTEAIIRMAGESAVLTDRLQQQNDALDQLANSGLSLNQQMRSISADGLGHMEDALVDIITGTKSVREAFADMAKSIAADLARMAVRQAITIPLAMAMNSMFMGPAMGAGAMAGGMGMATGMPMPLYHTGGIVGSGSPQARIVSPEVFDAAPRFHSGTPSKLPALMTNETPAILKKDEGVFTPAQMASLGPAGGNQTVVVSPTINVTQPQGATQEQGQSFGKGIARELQGMIDDRIGRAFRPGGIRNQTGMAG